ncbi:MAG: FMN-binding protein, partial [Candidatus Margulisbacteria bacterium]|nr:FMN-binding protein [Candidatus Margulisiibacteriota bacterium]
KIIAKDDIDAITGATISSNAVCKGVRQAIGLLGKVKQ